MERTSTLPQTRRLGFRKRLPPWPPAVLGAGDLAKVHPTQGTRTRNRKKFGWHTFRHTYSTLLRSVGTEFKVIQELLRHSSLRSTLDVYTQAITPAKQAAQAAVMALIYASETKSTAVE